MNSHALRPVVLLLSLLASASAFAQDAVRLRNGRVLSGEVAVDEKDDEGFSVACWDSGAVVRVLWSQVPEAEKDRLLRRRPDPTPRETLLDGVLVITASRDALGILVREDATQLHVKTARSAQPVVIPRSAVLRRIAARIFESEAFTPEEMIRRRADSARNDAAALVAAGKFAIGERRHDLARELYEKAALADPARQAEVAALIQESERLLLEEKAAELLADVRKALEELDHARATELARRFLTQFAETRLAQANANLVERIEKEAKEFAIHRAEVLAAKVPDLWRLKRAELLARAATMSFADARGRVGKLDEEIETDLARRLKSSVSEIQVAWMNRPEKARVASYGSGTWIVRGGQNGGMDVTMPPPDPNASAPTPTGFFIPLRDANGNVTWWVEATSGGSGGSKPKELGQPLLRQEDWWSLVGLADRRAWLEAQYAETSSRVRRLEDRSRKCSACNGGAGLWTSRWNVHVRVLCPRCHGVKEDVAISYW